MADVKVTSERSMTRSEVAELLSGLASSLAQGGKVELELGAGNTVSLAVPDDVVSELEVEVEGDEIEVELQLTWSTSESGKGDVESD